MQFVLFLLVFFYRKGPLWLSLILYWTYLQITRPFYSLNRASTMVTQHVAPLRPSRPHTGQPAVYSTWYFKLKGLFLAWMESQHSKHWWRHFDDPYQLGRFWLEDERSRVHAKVMCLGVSEVSALSIVAKSLSESELLNVQTSYQLRWSTAWRWRLQVRAQYIIHRAIWGSSVPAVSIAISYVVSAE